MTLLSPIWLASLIALPLLAALYFLKVRPSRKPTNAYFLWQQIYQAKQSSAFFRRLRDLWSLLFMLLALLCICLALAEPVFEGDDDRDLIVILDATASMQADSDGKPRLARAKVEAERLIRSLNGSQQAAVLSLSDGLHFHAHLTRSPRELLNALEAIEGSELPFRPEALTALGSGWEAGESPYRVVLITDGNSELDTLPGVVEPLVLESEAVENVGIVAADVQWLPGRGGATAWFFRILNAGAREAEIDLELEHLQTGRLAKLVPLRIAPGDTDEVVFDLEGAEPGHWRARLLVDDALALDDEIVLGLNPVRPIQVGIDAGNAWFFQNCVEAFARSGGALQVATDLDSAELRLTEGAVPEAEAHILVFKPEGASPYWTSLGESAAVGMAEVVTPEHPFLEHLDMEGVVFRGVREIGLPPGALVLVASDQGIPLFYKTTSQGRSAIVANFDPEVLNFYVSPWFPVVVYSAAVHLADRENSMGSALPTGTSLELAASESLRFLPGAGLLPPAEGVVDLRRRGAYQIETPTSIRFVGAGLLSETESRVHAQAGQSVAALASGWPVRWYLILAALIILALECVLYHRRKLG